MFVSIVGWCVYTHSFGGEVFYVGKGRGSRPFEYIGANDRNELWRAKVDQLGGFDVAILKWFGDEKSALRFEKKMIDALQPDCNKTRPGRRSYRNPNGYAFFKTKK